VVIVGGELVGCEIAEMLANAGKQVTVTTLEDGLIAFGVHPQRGALVYSLCNQHKVPVLTVADYRKITSDSVVLVDKEGKEQALEADSVVIAAGTRSNNGLVDELKKVVPEVYAAGDCVETRSMLEAMREGYLAGLSI